MMNMFVRHANQINPHGDFRTSARLFRIVRAGESILLAADKYDTARYENNEMSEIVYRIHVEHRAQYWKAISNIARYSELFK